MAVFPGSENMTSIKSLWHATAMAADYEALLGPLQRLFGAVVMHDQSSEEPAIGRRGGMIWIGDNSIEIGVPLGPTSPVRNFVEKWGGGMHSLAVQVPDGQQWLTRLADLGVQPAAFVSPNMYFTRPADTAGILLEWASEHTNDDPRWGYELGPQVMPPLVPALQYAFITAVVNDPVAVATRLSTLFGTDIVRLRPEAAADEIAAIISLGDNLLVLFRVPDAGTSVGLWGQDITRTRLHAQGIRVADLGTALALLRAEGIGVSHTIEGMAFLDPTSVSIPTFLCDTLLPEDPRNRAV